MFTSRSTDGTTIAYDRIGAGTPVILVGGALCYRTGDSSSWTVRITSYRLGCSLPC